MPPIPPLAWGPWAWVARVAALVVLGAPGGAEAQLVPWSVDARLVGELERDRPYVSPDGRDVEFESTERLVLNAGVEGERWLGEHFGLGGRADTGDLTLAPEGFSVSGRPLSEEAERTAFLRELWLAFEAGDETTVRLEAGRRRLSLGHDLLLDNYTLGGNVEVEHGALTARLGAAQPGADLVPSGPPVYYATLGYALDAGDLELLYARDTGAADEVQADVARQVNLSAFANAVGRRAKGQAIAVACLEPPPSTEVGSVLHWVGVSLEHAFRGGQFEAAWLTVFGHFDVETRLKNEQCIDRLERLGRPTSRTTRTDVLGHALSVDARYHLRGPWFPGLFAVWMSGNGAKAGSGGDYDGFLSIAPFPRRPVIFFDVGATSSVRTDRAATPGVNGRGVLAAGPTLLLAPTEALSFDATAAWLQADKPNPATNASAYGVEFDLRTDWDFSETGSFFAEVGALRMGDFHPERRLVWQFAVGCLFVVEGDPAP